ncbi:MAG: MerR family transcriptional regulator [Anaerolineae bacterium]|nr:MerR family transcriptional regulator [Anaerolineae bacterium]
MDQNPGQDEPCYVISVVAKLVDLHPQTLRRYEEIGLIKPARASGRRLYSSRDLERLRRINRLVNDLGVNLAGVEVILNMSERLEYLQKEMNRMQAEFEAEIERLRRELERIS